MKSAGFCAAALLAGLAWTPSLVLAGAPDSLGRLFTSEAERRAVDDPPPRPKAPKPRARTVEIRVEGIVRREDGRDTIWLNGEARQDVPDLDGHSTDRIRVRTASGKVEEVPVGSSFEGEARAWGFE
ncbi:hypothetical protein [Niveibacterium sp. SC-1]|uniref:hypothetical protein n=1 Tax=Niveibacterium sp. SC-1 TaxID=3135646 RepID=UPI00311EE934